MSSTAGTGVRRRPRIEQVRVRVLPDGRLSRRNAALPRLQLEDAGGVELSRQGPTAAHDRGGRVFYYLRDLDAFIASASD